MIKPCGALKLMVIGTGHIGTYMRICYQRAAGGVLRGNVLLNKATPNGLAALERDFDCEVAVGGTLDALRRMEPDLVLVCPPPRQIPPVVTGSLAPYCREQRERGGVLPDILSFAPTPSVDYFYERLGTDVNAVKVLPNMFYSVAGLSSAYLEANFITFSDAHPWPEANRARLYDFLSPLVNTIEVREEDSVPYLGMRNAAHCYYDMCYLFADMLSARGLPGGHQEAASVMRAALRRTWDDLPRALVPCSMDSLDPHCAQFVADCAVTWLKGVCDFAPEAGLPDDAGHVVRAYRAEAYLVTLCLLSRPELDRMTAQLATKGGVCEKSGLFFQAECRDMLAGAFGLWLDHRPLPEGWWARWRAMGLEAARAIARHGLTLCG